ncbi:MAG: zf-TFIIB domain-containing protein [Gammaproteobacteria bacterium]|nr:zf-TFIIB domain-containing protein [Gammaproteobacteria bacterium]
MLCPIDNETLLTSERNGVEIDYCPRCRGVWLGRGELDKIIERAARGGSQDHRVRTQFGPQKHHRKKKESFLSELFDF